MYKVIGNDGKEYGPISADTVKQWIADGRLSAASKVQSEGTVEWRSIYECPEFQEALTSTPAAAKAPTRVSRLAITSLILGVFGCLGITALAGFVCGIVALIKISKSQGRLRGKGLAIAGTCISGMMLLLAIPLLAGLLLPALSQAKGKAQSIACVNNMKQIGLALRLHSTDNNEVFPSDFLSMSNELSVTRILLCPAETRQRPPISPDWASLDTNSISYEYLTPGASEQSVISQVVVRCPIHGHVGLGDGSVQQGNLNPRQRGGGSP